MADKNLFLKDYSFYGKHAEMVSKLCSEIDEESGAKIFNSFVELFIFAPLIGVYYDHRSQPDKDRTKDKKIFASQFVNDHNYELKLVFKFVTLLGNEVKYDEVTRLNKTFRNPETDENYIAFEEYMLGGIEEIYDKLIIDSNKTYQDYLTSISKMLSDFKKVEEIDDVFLNTEDFF